ncbi:hypothetical protein SEVIR_3G418501v4 [Setaria viridis]|uniref:Uncharacterized protein n=1 Tax=Setaria viridis TaxID=4556 RepID=A0A4U6VPV6_SETVI|nr:hypothetical protein SEVIR_3G418501v2 [Setaria viridis]
MRYQIRGMGLLLLCFGYCCNCRDGWQAMKHSLFKFMGHEDTSNCICLCIVRSICLCLV